MSERVSIQELRGGNILNYYTAEGDVLPVKIDWQGLKWLSEDPEGFNSVHSSIEITEEYLLKFGFEKFEKFEMGYSKNAFSPGHPSQRFDIDWSEENGIKCKSRYQADSDYFFMRHIKHVHQLQNLYYALTGEELYH